MASVVPHWTSCKTQEHAWQVNCAARHPKFDLIDFRTDLFCLLIKLDEREGPPLSAHGEAAPPVADRPSLLHELKSSSLSRLHSTSSKPSSPHHKTAPRPLQLVLFFHLVCHEQWLHVGTSSGKMNGDFVCRQHINAPDPTEDLLK